MSDAGAFDPTTWASRVRERSAEISGLEWGVKASFRAYVLGVGGTVLPDGVAVATGDGYRFPVARIAQDGSAMEFAGAVAFTAHDGLLALTVRDPQLAITDDGLALSVAVDGQRLVVGSATIAGSADDETGPFPLEDAAAVIFNFTYPAGTPLDAARVDGLA
jgi:hypothetical protein